MSRWSDTMAGGQVGRRGALDDADIFDKDVVIREISGNVDHSAEFCECVVWNGLGL